LDAVLDGCSLGHQSDIGQSRVARTAPRLERMERRV